VKIIPVTTEPRLLVPHTVTQNAITTGFLRILY